MFDLEKAERVVILVLTLALLTGIGVGLYKNCHKAEDFIIEKFSVDSSRKGKAALEGLKEGRVDINSSSAEELTRLKGIGPTLARRIIEYRDAHGPFLDPEEIKRVKGIGPALYEKIRDEISVQ